MGEDSVGDKTLGGNSVVEKALGENSALIKKTEGGSGSG